MVSGIKNYGMMFLLAIYAIASTIILITFDGVAGGERSYWIYFEWIQVPLGLWPVSFGACHAHCFSGLSSTPD